MASSPVEIVSSSPFGCVLKDHNRRDRCRERNARAAAFQKNLEELVRDHFQNCITVSADDDDENSDRNSHKRVHPWVAKEEGTNGNEHNHNRNLRFLSNNNNGKKKRTANDDDYGYGSSILSSRQSRILDRWAAKQALEMVSTIEKQSQEAELLATSAAASSSSNPKKESLQSLQNSPAESEASTAVGNLGASSLVQMWERRLNRSNSLNNTLNPVSTSSRTSSGVSNNDSEASRESEMVDSADERDEARTNNEDSFVDWESQSDKTAHSEPPTSRYSDAGESEKVRIADIIKRLTSASDDVNDHDPGTSQCESPSRERRHSPVMDQGEPREPQRENKSFSRVICSPKIRGRQAFADLLMQLERDRHRELDALAERQAVSRFTHRGRIQAMLRLRFLHRGMAIQDQQLSLAAGSRSFNRLSQRSAIRHLREKFSPGADHGVTAPNEATTSRNPHVEMENNTVQLKDSSNASGLKEDGQLQEATTAGRKSTASKDKSMSQKSEEHQKEANPKADATQKGTKMATTSDHQKEAIPKTDVTQKGLNTDTTSDHQKDANMKANATQKGLNMVTTTDHQKEANLKIDVTQKGLNMEATSLDPQRLNMVTIPDHQKEANMKTDVTQRGLNMETTSLNKETISLNGSSIRSEIAENQEANTRGKSQPTASLDGQNANEMADEAEDQETNVQQQLFLGPQENAVTTASLNNWDENELSEEEEETYLQDQFLETNYDWISEISRPRSYWEDRRQTWYREMLNSSSQNEEIRQLLERRRVSTFLCSDFRDRMDQLMTARVERQTELEAYQEEEEEEMSQETVGQLLLAHLQRHMHSAASQEGEQAEEGDQVEQVDEPIVVEEEVQEPQHREEDEEQEEEEDEPDEEQRSPTSPLFHEASDDFDQSSPSVQMTSPSTIQTWSYQDHEVGDDSDPVASTSSPQPLPAQAYYQDSRQSSSSTNHISIETELIYDLRGQIEQLHREMSELRKSVQSCVDMQVKLHQSNQQEVHPVQGMGNNSLYGAPKKRSCCICYEMQVDSLLYRCGHMCTCLKCAHELQWSSGKCPICRAPIDDVVRAFMDS